MDLSFADLSLILKNEGYFLTIFSAAGSRSEDNSNSSNRWVILTINCLAVMKTLVLGNLFKLSRFSRQIRTCRWPRGKSEKKKWTCIFPIRQCHFNFAQKLESCTRYVSMWKQAARDLQYYSGGIKQEGFPHCITKLHSSSWLVYLFSEQEPNGLKTGKSFL